MDKSTNFSVNQKFRSAEMLIKINTVQLKETVSITFFFPRVFPSQDFSTTEGGSLSDGQGDFGESTDEHRCCDCSNHEDKEEPLASGVGGTSRLSASLPCHGERPVGYQSDHESCSVLACLFTAFLTFFLSLFLHFFSFFSLYMLSSLAFCGAVPLCLDSLIISPSPLCDPLSPK